MTLGQFPPTPPPAPGVSGPVVSVDNHVVLFDGITGQILKDSGKLLADPAYNWQSETPAQSGLHQRFYHARAGIIVGIRPYVVKGDGTTTMEVDILKNGATIFPAATKPNVAAGSFANGSFVPDTTGFADGDYYQVNVINTGTTLGALRLTITFKAN